MQQKSTLNFGFAYYALAGFALAFGFITGFSFGLPILLLGVYLLARPTNYPAAARLGVLTGFGIVALVIAALGTLGPPPAWLAIGSAAVLVGALGFWWLECRSGVRHGLS